MSARARFAALAAGPADRVPEMRAIADRLAVEDAGLPPWTDLPIEAARVQQARGFARWNVDLPPVDRVTRVSVPGPGGAIACDLVEPEGARPGCLAYLHGGGWAFGDLASHQRLARLMANATRTAVLLVDYRLAPEHPFPAPLDDAIAAWRWLAGQAAHRPALDGPLWVGGDSAGANLALALCLAEDAAGRRAPQGAILFYGVYAADFDTASYRRFAEGYGLTRAGMMRFWDLYAPDAGPSGPRHDPLACPALASEAALARLPPLWLNAAGLDPLLDDTAALVARLEEAGTAHELELVAGVHHGFMQMTSQLEPARAAIASAAAFHARHAAP